MVLEPEKKKKTTSEWWARLDKRARARHELARLVMGTIFLVEVSFQSGILHGKNTKFVTYKVLKPIFYTQVLSKDFCVASVLAL